MNDNLLKLGFTELGNNTLTIRLTSKYDLRYRISDNKFFLIYIPSGFSKIEYDTELFFEDEISVVKRFIRSFNE